MVPNLITFSLIRLFNLLSTFPLLAYVCLFFSSLDEEVRAKPQGVYSVSLKIEGGDRVSFQAEFKIQWWEIGQAGTRWNPDPLWSRPCGFPCDGVVTSAHKVGWWARHGGLHSALHDLSTPLTPTLQANH